MKNIELKIKVKDFSALRILMKKIGARKIDVLNQIDTYFNVGAGRLKMREINGKKFELILYRRPDLARSKVSDYDVLVFDKKRAFGLKDF